MASSWALRLLQASSLLLGARSWMDGFTCPPVNHADKADRLEVAGGRVFLPVFKHTPPEGKEAKVAIIVFHGTGRNGDAYFEWAVNAMIKQGREEETVVLAPVFPNKRCNASDWTGDPEARGVSAQWTSSRHWVFGATSDGFEDWDGISSYEVVDDMIHYAEMKYKSLRKVVVVGFSAGAQQGLRWSIMSPQGYRGQTLAGTKLSIVLGSPSSVVYLNDKRPAKSCVRPEDQSVNHTCDDFLIPGSGPDASETCHNHYDYYAFGTAGVGSESSHHGKHHQLRTDLNNYLQKWMPHDDALLRETLTAHWATKDIHFLWGNRDIALCLDFTCAKDCAAMVTGTSRLQRGLNYVAHLRDALPGYEPQYEIFEGKHRAELFFASDQFNRVALDAEGFEECLWDSFTCWSWAVQMSCLGASILGAALLGAGIVHLHHTRKAKRDGFQQLPALLLEEARSPERAFLCSKCGAKV